MIGKTGLKREGRYKCILFLFKELEGFFGLMFVYSDKPGICLFRLIKNNEGINVALHFLEMEIFNNSYNTQPVFVTP